MARIRTVKPEHWNDKDLPKIPIQAHLLWIGMWNFSDDKGVIEADPVMIKSHVFPRRSDVRLEQVSQWLDQLVNARFIVPFKFENESYYVHRTFGTHQRIDKPQLSKIPITVINNALNSKNDTGTIPLYSKGKDGKGEDGTPARKAEEILSEKYKSLTSGDWVNVCCKSTGLKIDDQSFEFYLKTFLLKNYGTDEWDKPEGKMRSHFTDWYNKKRLEGTLPAFKKAVIPGQLKPGVA